MKRKFFATLKQAERYQNRLYNQFHTVTLVQFPSVTESGVYVWKVSN
jgi:hypothetical protein